MSLEEKLKYFLETIPSQVIAQNIKSYSTEQQTETVSKLLETYANEAQAALALIIPFLSKEKRILEVGAGLCLLSFFLKKEGFDIVALEPATGGFDFVTAIQRALSNHFHKINLQILHIRAEEITAEQEGRFSLIFSHNVLEHINNPLKTLNNLLEVMEQQGKMVHSCPNYHIPYEPHFRIPLFPAFPKMSKRLFRFKITGKEALWDSLNFITYSDIKNFSKQQRLLLIFKREILYNTLSRLDTDSSFRQRQGNLPLIVFFNILKKTGLLRLVKYFPPALATPMVFIISRP